MIQSTPLPARRIGCNVSIVRLFVKVTTALSLRSMSPALVTMTLPVGPTISMASKAGSAPGGLDAAALTPVLPMRSVASCAIWRSSALRSPNQAPIRIAVASAVACVRAVAASVLVLTP